MKLQKFSSKTNHSFEVSIENYLKAIWNLVQIQSKLGESAPQYVSNSQLAAALKVSRPSVSGMSQKLARLGYVRLRNRGQIVLSKKGQERVFALIRRHRLIELFLHKTLAIDGFLLHQQAEHLEHAVSDELLNRMDQFLNFPNHGIDGLQIPQDGSNQHFEKCGVANPLRLSEMQIGERARVLSLPDYDQRLNERLLQSEMKIGDQIEREQDARPGFLKILLCKCDVRLELALAEADLIAVKVEGSTAHSQIDTLR